MGTTLALLRTRVNVPEPGVAGIAGRRGDHGAERGRPLEAALGKQGWAEFDRQLRSPSRSRCWACCARRSSSRAGRRSSPIAGLDLGSADRDLPHLGEHKNEQSRQDPTIGETLLGEMDTARVLFPVDANTATAALRESLHCRPGPIGLHRGVQARHARIISQPKRPRRCSRAGRPMWPATHRRSRSSWRSVPTS